MSRNELGDAGKSAIGEMGGFQGGGVGHGKGFGVAVTNIVHGINPREVGIEGGAVIGGRSRGSGFFVLLEERVTGGRCAWAG